jgi:hypothetical protein
MEWVVELRRMRYVWRKGEVHKRLVEVKRPIGKPRRRLEDDFKKDIQEME